MTLALAFFEDVSAFLGRHPEPLGPTERKGEPAHGGSEERAKPRVSVLGEDSTTSDAYAGARFLYVEREGLLLAGFMIPLLVASDRK